MRLFNTDTHTVTLTVALGDAFKSASLTTMGEEKLESLPVQDGKLVIEVPAKKILTIALA
jgi:hypothetical protein